MSSLNQHIQDATRTESKITTINTGYSDLLGVMKIFVAAGNMLDAIKKNIFYDQKINLDNWNNNLSIIGETALVEMSNTNNDITQLTIDPRLFHSLIGIATESTELIEAVVLALENDIDIDHVNVREEFFDLMWYLLIGHDAIDQDMDGTLTMGFDKLKKRYPDKFTKNHAINRNVEAEREILESHHVDSIDNKSYNTTFEGEHNVGETT